MKFITIFQHFSLKSLYHSLHRKFIKLNLFHSQSTDLTTVHREILSTRLYLVVLLISVFTLTLYTSINGLIKEKIVHSPSLAVYKKLQKQYPDTLQCPCTKLAIPYRTFVNVAPSFHQVCSSDFISQSWIDFTFKTNTTFIWPMDVRTSLSAMCQLLAAVCSSSTKIIFDTLNDFSNLPLINSMILPEDILLIKTSTALDLTIQMISNSPMKLLSTFEKISIANGLVTGLSTNYALRTFNYRPGGKAQSVIPAVVRYIAQGSNTTCTCMHEGTCPISGSFYLYDMWETSGLYDLNKIIPNQTLSGIVVDCTPLQMVFASSLECFYNQSCVDLILSMYAQYINISILNQIIPSRFMTTTNIKFLIENLFIEQIFNETLYDSYYKQCAPIHCSYTYSNKFDWIYVITILMSLYGGLNVVLRMMIPSVIDLILFIKRKRCCMKNKSQHNESISIKTRFIQFFGKVKAYIIKFNLFNNRSQDERQIRQGRLTTRLYLIFLVSTLIVLIVHTSFSMQTISTTIISPSQEQYKQLERQYSNTLQCPCTVVAIPYKEFIHVTPMYHQLCTSDFIRAFGYDSFPVSEYGQWSNIHFVGSSHVRTLAALCDLANLTIIDETNRFYSTMFINAQVISHDLFASKAHAFIDRFFNSTRAAFSNRMLLINTVIHVNQYITGLRTNFELDLETEYPLLDPSQLNRIRIITSSRYEIINHKMVYCARNASLMLWGESTNMLIAGLRIDCWIVNSVLESTLTCWYNSRCIDQLRKLLADNDLFLKTNITALNNKVSSRFPTNVRVKVIVDEVMVEKWNYSISYTDFYHKCRPAYCTFSYQKRMNVLYIIITLIALFGGLNIVSWLVIPSPIKLLLKRISRIHSNNSLPTCSTQVTNNRE
ncbi:unnamed protein product [Adineta steineri]|uniref:Uncharacterized protein n=2 Tax=Adineta steineri TaxID=433720 RepID=A0A813QKP0_9BILA|nr:unnamed protein product [Adineta steineri]